MSYNTDKILEEIFTDEELIGKLIESNENHWFGLLYDRYEKLVYNKCYQFVHNQAEAMDMTHDIFLKLFLNIRKFEGRSKFSSWFYSFIYNFCMNYVSRNPSKMNVHEELSEGAKIPEYDDDIIIHLKVDLLQSALKKLNPPDRIILLMKYQDDFKIAEIANTLEIGQSAVKMKLLRAKAKLVNVYNQLELVS